jgi:endogenous inhibitor of DNA gyrase (YacG/DUF329 family)
MADNPNRYVAQFYQSPESTQGPHAITDNEEFWIPLDQEGRNVNRMSLAQAMITASDWTRNGNYKTTRVIEINDVGDPVAVMWMSAWERAMDTNMGGGAAPGMPGHTIKVLVWKHRDYGPPDHWDWSKLAEMMDFNFNRWDLVYGREIDRKGREILWSIRLNLYLNPDQREPIEWPWYTVFGYKKQHRDKVEPVLAHTIDPRSFPDGTEKVDCKNCSKTIDSKESWRAYDPEEDEMAPFCSCKCIDLWADEHYERVDPMGQELEMPGCVVAREREYAV